MLSHLPPNTMQIWLSSWKYYNKYYKRLNGKQQME